MPNTAKLSSHQALHAYTMRIGSLINTDEANDGIATTLLGAKQNAPLVRKFHKTPPFDI